MAERKVGKRQLINTGTDKRNVRRDARGQFKEADRSGRFISSTGRSGAKSQQLHERVEVDPDIQHGKPVIKGTRVPVSRILGAIAGGMSFAEIANEYGVTLADVKAAVTFANEVLADSTFYATSL